MNILIQIKSTASFAEIKEYIDCTDNEVYLSQSTSESIVFLGNYYFDIIVVEMKGLNDVGILKFINDYNPDIQVIVIANESVAEIIKVFQRLRYQVINEAIQLSDLKSLVMTTETVNQLW
jgi:two-component SAPR family response regulator